LDRIGQLDGVTQTIMLAENMNSQNWGYSNVTQISNAILDTAFVVNAGPASGGGTPEVTLAKGSLAIVSGNLTYSMINANKGNSPGQSPAPSSLHPGVVNVMFCDGHGATLAETMDESVFTRLVSSGGVKYGQVPLGDTQF